MGKSTLESSKKLSYAIGIATLSMGLAQPSMAFDTSIGDVDVSINTQLSAGVSIRHGRPNDELIDVDNGGTGSSGTTDDGNLNFSKGDVFSAIIKGVTDIRAEKDEYGALVRFKYWYDHELENGKRPHGHSPNGYATEEKLDDSEFSDFAKFSGIELLDAFVYTYFDIGDMPLDVRLGRQVISWGESTFIQGGINSVNPFDVSAFRRPGAELKEGLLPVGMLYGNLGVSESLSVEAFYQYEWAKTEIDGCGTYFSTNDFAADGCNFVTIGPIPDATGLAGGFFAERQPDREPDDDGQYGLAVRFVSEALNDTEFGLYYMNIHSRVPMISAIRDGNPGTDAFNPADPANNAKYLVEYPEDQQLIGASFATNLSGVAWSGEITYKPDLPIQISGSEILNAALSEAPVFTFYDNLQAVNPGEYVRGWDEYDVTQVQTTVIKFFDRVLGASRMAFIGEAGAVFVSDLADLSEERYGRNSVYGVGDTVAACPGCSNEGFVTDFSWGIRTRVQLDYPNVYSGLNLKPTFAYSHDVKGYSPEPGPQFNEGRRSFGLSLAGDYNNQYNGSISYTNFFGGDYNATKDRDFIALSVGYAF